MLIPKDYAGFGSSASCPMPIRPVGPSDWPADYPFALTAAGAATALASVPQCAAVVAFDVSVITR